MSVQKQLIGPPNGTRFPDYASLNLASRGSLPFEVISGRSESKTLWIEKNTIVSNIDAPNFGAF